MFEHPLVAKYKPNMLNKFKEDKITQEIVSQAVKSGYKISYSTRAFLFKYREIAQQLLEINDLSGIINTEKLSYVKEHFDIYLKVLDLIYEQHSRIYNIDYETIDFKDIVVSKESADFINRYILISYLKEYPDYIYSEYVRFPSIIFPELVEFIKDNNIDVSRINNLDEKLFFELLPSFPEIAKDERYIKYFTWSNSEHFIELLDSGKFSVQYIPFDKIKLSYYTDLIVKYPEALSYIPFDTKREFISKNNKAIVNEFINNLPDSLKNLELISSYIDAYYVTDEQKQAIIDAIISTDFKFNNVGWHFIYSNKGVMLKRVIENPNLLNTCNIVMPYENLSQEEYDMVYNAIVDSGITVYGEHGFLLYDERIFEYLRDKNPLYYMKNYRYNIDLSVLEDRGISLLPNFSLEMKDDNLFPFYCDLIRENPKLILRINLRNLSEDKLLELFEVFLEAGGVANYELLNRLQENKDVLLYLLKNHPELRRNSDISWALASYDASQISHYFCSNYDIEYLINEYGVNKNDIKRIAIGSDNCLKELRKNFSYIVDIPYLDKLRYQKEIAEIYFENRDANLKYFDSELRNNVYVVARELALYNNEKYYNSSASDEIKTEFTRIVKEHNINVPEDKYYLINDYEMIYELVKNEPELYYYFFSNFNYTNEQRKSIYSVISEALKKGIITYREVGNKYIEDNYEEIKAMLSDVHSLYDFLSKCLRNKNLDSTIIKSDILELYNKGLIGLSVTVLEAMDRDEALNLIKENPYLLRVLFDYYSNSNLLYIIETLGIDSNKFYDQLFNVDGMSKEQIISVFKLTRNVTILAKAYDKGIISKEEYTNYYLEVRKNILDSNYDDLNGLTVFDLDGNMDYELLEYLSSHNYDRFIEAIEGLSEIDEKVRGILLNIYPVLSDVKKNQLLRNLSPQLAHDLIMSDKDSINIYRFCNNIIDFTVDIISPMEVYNIWVSLGKPLNIKITKNCLPILFDLMKNNPEDLRKISVCGFSDPQTLTEIANKFFEYNLSDITINNVFSSNPMIISRVFGLPLDFTYVQLANKVLPLVKDNQLYFRMLKKSFHKYLTDIDINLLVECINFDNDCIDFIISEMFDRNYQLSERTPEVYLTKNDVLEYYFEKNPDNIKYFLPYLHLIQFNEELKNKVFKYIIDNKMLGVNNKNTLSNAEYLLECIIANPYFIEEMASVSVTADVYRKIVVIILDAIKNNRYKLSTSTPRYLLYNDELYEIAKKECPEIIKDFYVLDKTQIYDYSELDMAMQNPENVNSILKSDRIYPMDLIDKLVLKLIEINYIPDDNTPKILFDSPYLIKYMIDNGYKLSDKEIEKFVTFANLQKLKDVELFKRFISQGYGYQFQRLISKIGLDDTLKVVIDLGDYVNCCEFSSFSDVDSIYKELLNGVSIDAFDAFEHIVDYKYALSFVSDYNYSRILNMFFINEEKNQERIDYLFTLRPSIGFDSPILKNKKYLLKYLSYVNSDIVNRLIDYIDEELLDKDVVELAITRGYKIKEGTPKVILNNMDYINNAILECKDNKEMDVILNLISPNEEIIKTAVGKGYYLNSKSPDYIKNDIRYIKLMIMCNSENAVAIRSIIGYSDVQSLESIIDESNINTVLKYFIANATDSNFEQAYQNMINVDYETKRRVFIKFLRDLKRLNKLNSKYEDYVFKHFNILSVDKLDDVVKLLKRVELSNSGEIIHFAETIVTELLNSDNPEEDFSRIEKIFLQCGVPIVNKLFIVFKILNKDYSNLETYKTLSPVLKGATSEEKDRIIYKDLVIASFKSNNRSLRDYLNSLDEACSYLCKYKNGTLLDEELEKLNYSIRFVCTIINSNNIIDSSNKRIVFSSDYGKMLDAICSYFNTDLEHLKDSVVKHFFDIATYDEAVRFLDSYAKDVNAQNQQRALTTEFSLEPGDFIKGLGSIDYIKNILQNGSVAREFLGDCSGSDATPLDTDLSLVTGFGTDVDVAAKGASALGYGPIFIVLKKSSNKFRVTRDNVEQLSTLTVPYEPGFNEMFLTGALNETHYGVRTGFPSTDIDFFVVNSEDPRLYLEIALNGFYIPVVDKKCKLLFTPEMYQELRSKMSGLDYFDAGPYKLASYSELFDAGIKGMMSGIEANRADIKYKHSKIKEAISAGFKLSNVKLKDKIDGDLIPGFAELIDTGSTARGTDLPGKADFDYMCRVDKNLYIHAEEFEEFKKNIRSQFKSIEKEEYVDGNFRFKGVEIEGLQDRVDIDLSFVVRTTKLSLSSDDSLLHRLETIRGGNIEFSSPEDEMAKYPDMAINLVTANILMAKRLLKKYKAYKKHSSPEKEGGLGGIGVENWILQNGGSLKKAAERFLELSKECNYDYELFKKKFQIWDFGENHYSFGKSKYPHDDFVYNNMDASGYEKMCQALKDYLEYGTKVFEEDFVSSELEQEVSKTK